MTNNNNNKIKKKSDTKKCCCASSMNCNFRGTDRSMNSIYVCAWCGFFFHLCNKHKTAMMWYLNILSERTFLYGIFLNASRSILYYTLCTFFIVRKSRRKLLKKKKLTPTSLLSHSHKLSNKILALHTDSISETAKLLFKFCNLKWYKCIFKFDIKEIMCSHTMLWTRENKIHCGVNITVYVQNYKIFLPNDNL